jgi:hypothetical protein
MLDPLEAMEASAERRYDEMLQPDGRLRCECGKLFHSDDGQCTSPNPYAMPVCPACFEEWAGETLPLDAKPYKTDQIGG